MESSHDRARIEKVALEFGNALCKDERLLDVLSNSLYEWIFTFFGKVQDRLDDPMKILLGQRWCVYPRSLSIVLLEMVPLIVKQGKQLLQR